MKTLHYLDVCLFPVKVKYKIYHTIALFIVSSKAYSIEDAAVQTIKSDPMSSSYLLQLVFGLLIVVLCIFALAWFSKKMNRFNSSSDDALKIIGAISMGSRERIVHLQIGEEQLLIGVSPGRINTLHVLNKPVETITKSNSVSVGNGFSDKLKTMILDVNKPNDKKTK